MRWTAIFQTKFFQRWSTFHILGYVNKQNCHIWGSENPQVIEERPLHPEKITVWYALWSEDVIVNYFFENDNGTTCHLQFGALWSYDHRLFFAWYWRIRLGECLVSTRRCHMPHNWSEYWLIATDISWLRNFSSWRYQLVTKIMRFDTIIIFLWGYGFYGFLERSNDLNWSLTIPHPGKTWVW